MPSAVCRRGDCIDKPTQIGADMGALAGPRDVALPFERYVEPRKIAVAVIAGKPARAAEAENFSRIQVRAQIDREVEAIRREPALQRIQIILG